RTQSAYEIRGPFFSSGSLALRGCLRYNRARTGQRAVPTASDNTTTANGPTVVMERDGCRLQEKPAMGKSEPISISRMAAAVQPSATLAAGAKARQLEAEGVHVFDFSLGEPDFPTPEPICAAAVEAMRQGRTRYTPAGGIAALRAAVARCYQKTYGIRYTADQVVVSSGAKHSLHNALAATVGPGDEVIIPTPYWVSYSDLVQMTGARFVLVGTTQESGFKMTPGQLRGALTPHSRLVMLNSPSNPTGTVYTRAELEALADVVLDAGLAVIS